MTTLTSISAVKISFLRLALSQFFFQLGKCDINPVLTQWALSGPPGPTIIQTGKIEKNHGFQQVKIPETAEFLHFVITFAGGITCC